jgi:outer membrane protein OmpA-like peptidoglycan-associated protein
MRRKAVLVAFAGAAVIAMASAMAALPAPPAATSAPSTEDIPILMLAPPQLPETAPVPEALPTLTERTRDPERYPYVLFFDWDSAQLSPEAASVLDLVADDYRRSGPSSVTLAGFADGSAAGDHDRDLARRRAEAAKAYLIARAIPEGAIAIDGSGESRPQIETIDGMREPQNRRVEATVTPAKGVASAH